MKQLTGTYNHTAGSRQVRFTPDAGFLFWPCKDYSLDVNNNLWSEDKVSCIPYSQLIKAANIDFSIWVDRTSDDWWYADANNHYDWINNQWEFNNGDTSTGWFYALVPSNIDANWLNDSFTVDGKRATAMRLNFTSDSPYDSIQVCFNEGDLYIGEYKSGQEIPIDLENYSSLWNNDPYMWLSSLSSDKKLAMAIRVMDKYSGGHLDPLEIFSSYASGYFSVPWYIQLPGETGSTFHECTGYSSYGDWSWGYAGQTMQFDTNPMFNTPYFSDTDQCMVTDMWIGWCNVNPAPTEFPSSTPHAMDSWAMVTYKTDPDPQGVADYGDSSVESYPVFIDKIEFKFPAEPMTWASVFGPEYWDLDWGTWDEERKVYTSDTGDVFNEITLWATNSWMRNFRPTKMRIYLQANPELPEWPAVDMENYNEDNLINDDGGPGYEYYYSDNDTPYQEFIIDFDWTEYEYGDEGHNNDIDALYIYDKDTAGSTYFEISDIQFLVPLPKACPVVEGLDEWWSITTFYGNTPEAPTFWDYNNFDTSAIANPESNVLTINCLRSRYAGNVYDGWPTKLRFTFDVAPTPGTYATIDFTESGREPLKVYTKEVLYLGPDLNVNQQLIITLAANQTALVGLDANVYIGD